jgi:hypothetical protein
MINLWKANKKHRLKKYHKSTCMGTCLSNTVDNPTPSAQKGHQLTSLSSKIQCNRNPKKLPTLYIANPHHFQRWKNLKMHNKVNFPKYNNGELANRYPMRGEQSNIKFCYCLLNLTLSSSYPLIPNSFHIWNIQGKQQEWAMWLPVWPGNRYRISKLPPQWDSTRNIWTYGSKVMRFLRFQPKLGHAVSHCQCSKICPTLPKIAKICPKMKLWNSTKNRDFSIF